MKRFSVPTPPTETLEDLVVQIWDALNHFRPKLGDDPYAESSFERDGKKYTVRITEVKAA